MLWHKIDPAFKMLQTAVAINQSSDGWLAFFTKVTFQLPAFCFLPTDSNTACDALVFWGNGPQLFNSVSGTNYIR